MRLLDLTSLLTVAAVMLVLTAGAGLLGWMGERAVYVPGEAPDLPPAEQTQLADETDPTQEHDEADQPASSLVERR